MSLTQINHAMVDLISQIPLHSVENRNLVRNTIIQLQAELQKVYSLSVIELETVASSKNREMLVHGLRALPTTFEHYMNQFNIQESMVGLMHRLDLSVARTDNTTRGVSGVAIQNIMSGIQDIIDKLGIIAGMLAGISSHVEQLDEEKFEYIRTVLFDTIEREKQGIREHMDCLAIMIRNLLGLI